MILRRHPVAETSTPTIHYQVWAKQIPLHDGKATSRTNRCQLPILAKPLDPRLLHGPTNRIIILVRRRLDRHAMSCRRMVTLQLRT